MAGKTVTITENDAVAGASYGRTYNVNSANVWASEPPAGIPAAKTGQLTTRTDANTGTLTMDGGHGIITNDKISVFWSGGSRWGMTATVTVNSVAIDGGGGDDLPTNLTAITASVPTSETGSVVGDNAVCDVVYAALSGTDGNAYVEFQQANGTTIITYTLSPSLPSNSWDGIDDATDPATGANPFAGVTVGIVLFSHGETSVRTMGSQLFYN